ncbi:MAG TPA: nucleotidyltransferase family protein [Gemmatimonadales bacterium]|nr:nucleotidyltransferase family protein [Gemmatimonadales bacterium]
MTTSGVRAVVLAAGAGRRFGGDKLLAPLRGRPLLDHALAILRRAERERLIDGVVVVAPAGDHPVVRLALEAGCRAVAHRVPAAPLSHSIRLGLQSLAGTGAAAALVALGDQPAIRIEVVRALVEAWRAGAGPVVRPRYADAPTEPGHPLLLDRSLWPRAAELEGDAGFGPLLRRYPGWVTLVDVPGANPDIDTTADLGGFEESG